MIKKFVLACMMGFLSWGSPGTAHAYSWVAPGFHGGDGRLYTGDGDWAKNDWKGECGGTTKVLEGISVNPYYGQQEWSVYPSFANSVLCTDENQFRVSQGAGVTLDVWGRNDIRGSYSSFDWAYGNYKAECPDSYAITGIAQTSNSHDSGIAKVRCSYTNMGGFHGCSLVTWPNFPRADTSICSDMNGEGGYRPDWAVNYCKLSCGNGRFMKGLAVSPGYITGLLDPPEIDMFWTHDVMGILCCSPGY